MKNLLLVTDFYYKAKGRDYYKEDLELSSYLQKAFSLYIAHIKDARFLAEQVDVTLVRNTGPQALHKEHLEALRRHDNLLLSNDLKGKGDINGKGHLLELYKEGFAVIPTALAKKDLPLSEKYLLKPLDGADSCGVEVVEGSKMLHSYSGMLCQPLVDFSYEVSFYFIDDTFYYALYAPDPECRWGLELYNATAADIAFAKSFVNWNSCKKGIQRVDSCRLHDGRLLLMELEDYNPFLSLDALPQATKEYFIDGLIHSLKT